MKFSEMIEQKAKDVTFDEIKVGDVFAHGGWLTMKCVIDGSHFNAIHLSSGTAVQMHDLNSVKPINAVMICESEDFVRCKDCRMTKERDEYTGRLWCCRHREYMDDMYYCADGLRREEGEA